MIQQHEEKDMCGEEIEGEEGANQAARERCYGMPRRLVTK